MARSSRSTCAPPRAKDVQEKIRFALDAGVLQEGERRVVDTLQVVLGEDVQDSAFGACLHDEDPLWRAWTIANDELHELIVWSRV